METAFTYDSLNRVRTISYANQGVTTYDYDDTTPNVAPMVLEQVKVDASNYLKTKTYFDKFYRPIRTVEIDPAGDVTVSTEYDGDGRVKRVSEPYRTNAPVWTTTNYDVLNRPATITNPDGTVRQIEYIAGNKTRHIDETNRARTFSSDALGRLTRVTDPANDTSYSQRGLWPQPRLRIRWPRAISHQLSAISVGVIFVTSPRNAEKLRRKNLLPVGRAVQGQPS